MCKIGTESYLFGQHINKTGLYEQVIYLGLTEISERYTMSSRYGVVERNSYNTVTTGRFE
jgi:hypothetical protein